MNHTHTKFAPDNPAILTSDLLISESSACWGPAMDYISTNFVVDSSSHFHFSARKDI